MDLQVTRLRALLEGKGLGLRVSAAAADLLARQGYDPDFGARPLRRTIQRKVQDPLATRLLDGRFAPGDTVVVDVDENSEIRLVSEKACTEPPVAV